MNEARYQLRQSPAAAHTIGSPAASHNPTAARWEGAWGSAEPAARCRRPGSAPFWRLGLVLAKVFHAPKRRGNADVAQLVEHHLAKVRVAGSNPVVRSERVSYLPWRGRFFTGGVAERRGNGLQIRVHGFKSRLHLGRLAQW